MTYETLIARRYLLAREGGALAVVAMAISVLGVAIGVGALVCVISVMDGAIDLLVTRFVDLGGHATLAADEGKGFDNYKALCGAIDKVKGVRASAPWILRPAAVLRQGAGGQEFDQVWVQGVDLEREKRMSDKPPAIVEGRAPTGDKEIVLGVKLAERLGLKVGSDVTLLTETRDGPMGPVPKHPRLKVVGLQRLGHYDFDNMHGCVSLATAQKIFLLDEPPAATAIRVNLKNSRNLAAVMPRIREAVIPLLADPSQTRMTGWDENNRGMYDNLRAQKTILFLILMLIIVVAAFNIIGLQLLIVMRRTREIGILMSMGVPRRAVRRVFLRYGLMIGGIGTAVGTAAGLALCSWIASTDVIPLDETVYDFSRLPVSVSAATVLWIAGSAIAVCAAASLLPAWRASRLDPVEALRYE